LTLILRFGEISSALFSGVLYVRMYVRVYVVIFECNCIIFRFSALKFSWREAEALVKEGVVGGERKRKKSGV